MKRAHLKLWKALLAVMVCLFVALQPISGYSEVVSVEIQIDINVTLGGDQSVPYQYVELDNGYLWKPDVEEGWEPSYEGEEPTGSYWVPVGLWGSVAGKNSDDIRAEFGQLGGTAANSVGVEFSWSEIAIDRNNFSWAEYDALLTELKEKGLKAFVVIKLDEAPSWFADILEEDGEDLYTYYPPGPAIDGGGSTRISYTHPDVVGEEGYAQSFVRELVGRYAVGGIQEDLAPAVAGWIVDVGEGYVDRDEGTYIGYEDSSVERFIEWLQTETDYFVIGDLNDKWGTAYPDFESVEMPVPFDDTGKFIIRDDPGGYDLLMWRKQIFAEWIAGIVDAVRDADEEWVEPDEDGVKKRHLISVLTPGSEPGDSDYLYSSVDVEAILTRCGELDVPIDFWSIATEPSFDPDDEGVSTQWELIRTRAKSDGLPVLVLQMGYERSEDPDVTPQQKEILEANVWELIFGGAVGVHLYDGEDIIATDGTSMEVLDEVIEDMAEFEGMEITNELDEVIVTTDLMGYLVGSEPPLPEVGFLETPAQESIFNRGEAETYSLYGVLKRLGFQPGFININEFITNIYNIDNNYIGLILSRNQKMEESVFDELENALSSGLKLYANADLPGMLDEYSNLRLEEVDEDWTDQMRYLFGLDPEGVELDTDLEDDLYVGGYESASTELMLNSQGLESAVLGYSGGIGMWKYRNGLDSTFDADVLATFPDDSPALIMKANDTAISLFSLGDSKGTEEGSWGGQERYNCLELIYKNDEFGFGLGPEMGINLTGSPYVWLDYRRGPEDSVLIYLHNYINESQTVTLESDLLLMDKKIIKLIPEGESEYTEGGSIDVNVGPQDEVFLLATLALPPVIDEGDGGLGTEGDGDAGSGDDTGDVPSPGDSGDTVASSPSGSSGTTQDSGTTPSTSTTSSSTGTTSTESTADTPTTSSPTGSYTVIVLERDKEKEKSPEPPQPAPSPPVIPKGPFIRTTIGNGVSVSSVSEAVRGEPRSVREPRRTIEPAPVFSMDSSSQSPKWQTTTIETRKPITNISYPARKPQFKSEPTTKTQEPAKSVIVNNDPLLKSISTSIQRAINFIRNLRNDSNKPITWPSFVRKISKYVIGMVDLMAIPDVSKDK